MYIGVFEGFFFK